MLFSNSTTPDHVYTVVPRFMLPIRMIQEVRCFTRFVISGYVPWDIRILSLRILTKDAVTPTNFKLISLTEMT